MTENLNFSPVVQADLTNHFSDIPDFYQNDLDILFYYFTEV